MTAPDLALCQHLTVALLHPLPLSLPLQQLSILDYKLLYRKPLEHKLPTLQLGSF